MSVQPDTWHGKHMPEHNKKSQETRQIRAPSTSLYQRCRKTTCLHDKTNTEEICDGGLTKGGILWDAVNAVSRKQVEKVNMFNLYQLGNFLAQYRYLLFRGRH